MAFLRTSRFVTETENERNAAFLHLLVLWPKPRSERSTAFLHLLGLWPKPRSERSAALLHLWVCGQKRVCVKGARRLSHRSDEKRRHRLRCCAAYLQPL